jgi:hypothetical protein
MSKPANLIGASRQVKLGGIIAKRGVALRAGPAQQRLAEMRCPFTNLPEPERYRWDVGLTKADMGKLPLASTQARAQIEFTEQTPDGHLRHASSQTARL